MKLTIYAGQIFSTDFIVVSDDGVTGEGLGNGSTGEFSVHSTGANPECILGPISMSIVDPTNGTFNIELSADQTSVLSAVIGGEEDHFSPISNYIGFLSFQIASLPLPASSGTRVQAAPVTRQATVPLYIQEVPTCSVLA